MRVHAIDNESLDVTRLAILTRTSEFFVDSQLAKTVRPSGADCACWGNYSLMKRPFANHMLNNSVFRNSQPADEVCRARATFVIYYS